MPLAAFLHVHMACVPTIEVTQKYYNPWRLSKDLSYRSYRY